MEKNHETDLRIMRAVNRRLFAGECTTEPGFPGWVATVAADLSKRWHATAPKPTLRIYPDLFN